MAVDEPSADIAWVGLIVGTLFAVVCAVLILVGVVGGGVWFTVVAMGILALSHGLQLVRIHRTRRRV